MKKIVHIIASLNKGGAERFVVDLCNQLETYKEYDVYILSLYNNRKEGTFLSEIHPNVHYISFNKNQGLDLSVFIRVQKWLFTYRPAIVHTHTNSFEYAFWFRLLNLRNRFFFHTLHSKAEKECSNIVVKNIRRFFYKRNTIPVTISNDGSRTYQNYYHLSNDVLIENGRTPLQKSINFFTLNESYKNRDYFLLVHVGRITRVKNQKLLIESINLYNSRHEKKCHLFIIGSIREKDYYEELKKLMDKYILFLGDKSNIGDYLSIADAFCLSSTREGMPLSLIEALSIGCIPICTRVGGIPEMIQHQETGFLSKDFSIESYMETIEEFVTCEKKVEISENCIKEFRGKYAITIAARRYNSVYKTK